MTSLIGGQLLPQYQNLAQSALAPKAGSAIDQVQKAAQIVSSPVMQEQIQTSIKFAKQRSAKAFFDQIEEMAQTAIVTMTMRQFGSAPAGMGRGLTFEQKKDIIARAPESGARWNDFESKSSNDCSYFGIWMYDSTACDTETIATLQFAFDLYQLAWTGARALLRTNPDTYGIIDFVDFIEDPSVLDARCTHPDIARPDQPALARKVTWRGYARMRWYKAVCRFTSAAYWATNVRTGFLYGIGMSDRDAQRHGLPVGEPYVNAAGDELWAWGPDSVKAEIAAWWMATTAVPDRASRETGARMLFNPLSTQSFLSGSQDPGLDQPWVWGAEGRIVDTQTRAELKRGQRRRSARRAEGADREGFYGTQTQFDAVGGGRVQMPTNAKSATPASFLPERSMLPDLDLAALFSTRGNGLVPVTDVLGKGNPWWSVPLGDVLVRYTRHWLHEIADFDIVDHALRANIIYLDYLKRFAELKPLTDFPPEVVARLRESNPIVMEGGVEKVMWVNGADMTLADLEKSLQEMMAAKNRKTTGIVSAAIGPAVVIAFAIAGSMMAVPIAGWIAGVVTAIGTAIVAFFTWLFGGTLVGCPKAPRPMVLRTFDDDACSVDIASSKRTIEKSWSNLEKTGAMVGIRFTFPRSQIQPPPAGDVDWQFPGPPPPAVQGLSLGAKVALGLAAAAVVGAVVYKAR